MNKKLVICICLVLVFSLTFVSAGFFSDFFEKITGKQIEEVSLTKVSQTVKIKEARPKPIEGTNFEISVNRKGDILIMDQIDITKNIFIEKGETITIPNSGVEITIKETWRNWLQKERAEIEINPIPTEINPPIIRTPCTGLTDEASNIYEKRLLSEEKALDYLGHLAPFPTKSLQPYYKLKQLGIVDSEEIDLRGFYLLEGSLTQITLAVQNAADSIPDGATTRETIENIMAWQHQNLKKPQGTCDNHRDAVSADTIISRECASGCTDFTAAFVAIARAKCISATMTEGIPERFVAESAWNNKWLGDWNQGDFSYQVSGHFFSEVYLPEEQKWVVADPASNKFTQKYNGYYLGPLNPDYYNPAVFTYGSGEGIKYLLFERGLDPADYGVEDLAKLKNITKKRYYIKPYWQPDGV